MEIVPNLHESAKKVADMLLIDNITFLLGDSVQLLHEVMKGLNGDGAVFFIDAHQSGSDTSNNGVHVPIFEELDVILSYAVSSSAFIIDDVRLWKAGVWDWAHVTTDKIVEKISEKRKVLSSIEVGDRLYVATE